MNVSRLRPASAEERERERGNETKAAEKKREQWLRLWQTICALLLMEMDQIISSQGESSAYLLEMQFQLISS